jgi:hypothetical protein
VDALDKAILSSRVMTMAKCRANRPQGEAINFSHWSGVGSTAASPAQAGILIRMSLVGGGAKVAFRGAGCRLLLNSVPVPASVSVGSEAALNIRVSVRKRMLPWCASAKDGRRAGKRRGAGRRFSLSAHLPTRPPCDSMIPGRSGGEAGRHH